MNDFSNASTETSTPEVSSPSAEVAAASDAGAGEQTISQIPPAEANEQADTSDQIDVGWSLDDEQAVEPVDDDEADLEQLAQEPGLDPAKTPQLVERIRQVRAQNKELYREAQALRQQVAAFEQFGGIEGAQSRLEFTSQLLNASPETGGTMPALTTLFQQARPVYEQLVNDIVQTEPDYLVAALRQAGYISPEDSQPRATLDADTLAAIPQHLREVAKSLPANVMEDLLLQPEEVRNWTLEREQRMQQLDATQRQQEEQAWNQKVEAARQEAYDSVSKLSNQYEQAHYAQLAKWSPFGADQKDANTRIYKSVVEGAMSELLTDQKFAQMYHDAQSLLSNAPMRRLRNEGMAAGEDEVRARGLAAQFNTRLGQVIRERVKELDGVFRDARAYREQQRQNAPVRTEISGMGAKAGGNGKITALDKNGKVTPEYLQHLASQIPAMNG